VLGAVVKVLSRWSMGVVVAAVGGCMVYTAFEGRTHAAAEIALVPTFAVAIGVLAEVILVHRRRRSHVDPSG
jgi:hypothetical protein